MLNRLILTIGLWQNFLLLLVNVMLFFLLLRRREHFKLIGRGHLEEVCGNEGFFRFRLRARVEAGEVGAGHEAGLLLV